MFKRMQVAAFVGLVAVMSACAPTPAPESPPAPPAYGDVEQGRHLAELYCVSCHAIGTEGESPHPMAPPLRTLSRNYPVNALEEAFAEGILVGHPDMPEFRFEPDQIDDLLAYLQSIQERRGG